MNIYLKAGRDKSVRKRHPWVFSGAIERIEGEAKAGDEVRVLNAKGDFLARGFYSPASHIRCRLLRWQDEAIDAKFLQTKIRQAAQLRRQLVTGKTDAYRLVNAEGDDLPGLVVDRYGDILVLQSNNAGIERLKPAIVDILLEEIAPLAIYEKSDGAARTEDKLSAQAGVLSGDFNSGAVRITENGLIYYVDIAGGQKTGFYLDQRQNRQLVSTLVRDKTVLNGFAYTGAFSVAALAGGAKSVINVDSSRHALQLARKNIRENGFEVAEDQFVVADVFQFMRDVQEKFDVIILDPPALAKHRRDVDKAARAYKDLNLHAMQRLSPGGLLFTASCSQHISPDLFQKIIFAAATDAGKSARIIAERGHPVDHPISIYHPEGRYLHAFILSVD